MMNPVGMISQRVITDSLAFFSSEYFFFIVLQPLKILIDPKYTGFKHAKSM